MIEWFIRLDVERPVADAKFTLLISVPALLIGLAFGINIRGFGTKWSKETRMHPIFTRLIGCFFGVVGIICLIVGISRL